jgi:hypothetical protein
MTIEYRVEETREFNEFDGSTAVEFKPEMLDSKKLGRGWVKVLASDNLFFRRIEDARACIKRHKDINENGETVYHEPIAPPFTRIE